MPWKWWGGQKDLQQIDAAIEAETHKAQSARKASHSTADG